MTDHELLYTLEHSDVGQTRRMMHTLLWEPYKIRLLSEPEEGSLQVGVCKIYAKQPLIGGRPAAGADSEAADLLAKLSGFDRTYEIVWQ